MTTTHTDNHVIDATGKRLGRIATEAATLLLGKGRADVEKHVTAPVTVKIEHASKLMLGEKKRTQKKYQAYSGHPGGLREFSMTKLIEKKGYAEVVRKAVYGMLPSNRLRAQRMKNLTVSE